MKEIHLTEEQEKYLGKNPYSVFKSLEEDNREFLKRSIEESDRKTLEDTSTPFLIAQYLRGEVKIDLETLRELYTDKVGNPISMLFDMSESVQYGHYNRKERGIREMLSKSKADREAFAKCRNDEYLWGFRPRLLSWLLPLTEQVLALYIWGYGLENKGTFSNIVEYAKAQGFKVGGKKLSEADKKALRSTAKRIVDICEILILDKKLTAYSDIYETEEAVLPENKWDERRTTFFSEVMLPELGKCWNGDKTALAEDKEKEYAFACEVYVFFASVYNVLDESLAYIDNSNRDRIKEYIADSTAEAIADWSFNEEELRAFNSSKYNVYFKS